MSANTPPGGPAPLWPPLPPRSYQPGDTVCDCLLVRHLGAGAFADVWEARAAGDVPVAVKITRETVAGGFGNKEREALERTKTLRHPFLLPVQRFWVDEGGRLVMVQELAEGSLRERAEECRRSGLGGLPRHELLRYVTESAEALDYVHGEGLIHRDIKPGNILYLRGHAKVADLGLVKLSPEQDHASAAKSVAGTQPYMPREAMMGKATGASDQFSLAVTYAELRLGEPLHPEGDRTQVWLPYLGDRPDLSGLSRAERRAVARALAPDPLKRYKTCRELAGALQAAVEAAGWWRPLLRKFQGRGAPAETADSPTRDGDFRVPEAPAPAAESQPAPARDAPPPTTQRPHIVGTQAYAGEESPARREEGLSGVGDGMVRAAPASRRVRIVALAGLGLSLAALLITTAFMAFRDQHTGPEAPAISPAGNPGFTAFWGYAFSMVSVLGLAVAAAFLTVTVLRRSRSREGKSLAVVCPECNNVLPHDQVDKRLKRGNDSIRCIVCDTHIRFRPPAPKTVIKPPHPAPGTVRSPDVPTDRMFEFDVFLAHNNKDKPEVKATCQALKDCGLKPWLDVEQIPPGTFFQDVIQQGIARSMSAVVFLGLEGTGTFQAMELRAIIGKFVNTGRRVIPVLLPGVKEIPEELLFLQELHYVRFAKRMDEPEAIEQLLWGITGRRPQADPAEVVPPSPAADGAAPPGE